MFDPLANLFIILAAIVFLIVIISTWIKIVKHDRAVRKTNKILDEIHNASPLEDADKLMAIYYAVMHENDDE